jgi:simple sugar transport system permease protein
MRGFTLGRQQILGIIGMLAALTLFGLVATSVTPDLVSTLRITYPNARPIDPSLLDIPLPTVATTAVICVLLFLGGAYLLRGGTRLNASLYTSIAIFATIFLLLVWAIAGERTDLVDMLARMVRLATPIALGALAGILCERSGVVNIGIEGLMLTGACLGFIAALTTGNTWFGLLIAMLAGGAIVMIHAVLALRFKIDQIISGTVINILAVGVTGYLRANAIIPIEAAGASGSAFQTIPIPLLSQIPVLGPVFFNHRPITYLMLVLVPLLHLLLFRTVWGVRTRAVGEHPRAADTVGINVNRLRYLNVFASGLMAGLAGAWFSLEATFNFDDVMTNGRGFIALAAMIFGKWTPFGALGGALIFSSADALQIKIQGFDFALPAQFLQMLPYVITIIVLAGVIGRARPPAALGKPYDHA